MPGAMKLAALALAAFLVASPRPAAAPDEEARDEDGFVASAETFTDARGCIAHLAGIVATSTRPAWDNAVGPYVIASGDVRAHRVKARDRGHDIEEHRCLGARLDARRWTHSMNDVKPITVEDIGKMDFPE